MPSVMLSDFPADPGKPRFSKRPQNKLFSSFHSESGVGMAIVELSFNYKTINACIPSAHNDGMKYIFKGDEYNVWKNYRD